MVVDVDTLDEGGGSVGSTLDKVSKGERVAAVSVENLVAVVVNPENSGVVLEREASGNVAVELSIDGDVLNILGRLLSSLDELGSKRLAVSAAANNRRRERGEKEEEKKMVRDEIQKKKVTRNTSKGDDVKRIEGRCSEWIIVVAEVSFEATWMEENRRTER